MMKRSEVGWSYLIFNSAWGVGCVLLVSCFLKFSTRVALLNDSAFWESGYTAYLQLVENFIQHGHLFFNGGNGLYDVEAAYALRPPLYPMLVVVIAKLTGFSQFAMILTQAIISTGTVAVVYWITRQIFNPKAAFFAAVFCAFYPYTFIHDVQFQETGLYNFLSIVSVACLFRAVVARHAWIFLVAGLALGLAALARASHVFHAVFVMAWVLFYFRGKFKAGCLRVFVLACGLMLVLSPWMIRNKLLIDSFTLTTIGGKVLTGAHNEYTFKYYPYEASIDDSVRYFKLRSVKQGTYFPGRDQNEVQQNRWYTNNAIQYIAAHKLQFLRRGLIKASVNFIGILSPLKTALANNVYFISYWLLTLLAILGARKVWPSPYVQIFLVLILSQAAFSFVFWTHSSHRSFLDPMLAVVAGIGFVRLLELISRMMGRKTDQEDLQGKLADQTPALNK